ncbi:MAG: hypothetical protein COU31_03665 [Candidatus Magasanikbacteria bacterium CG10_big_fil_rev_8_21_14_0_10_40_10]|uniref:Uncharacterized protein n=1 Tax=Candidatus Magasanikbacteria bacterium CG10_big_fil_rev_8_21_14_0_10_40_10 TaxID=1974648 RepID=A0A2M6W3C5_9BACT|nr:MAG: hypothetical protein COU31_03665 [Candidatus Magasanikbacteria bacterium CG10_big_fil_rev_8_21_14_0_10_40_10]
MENYADIQKLKALLADVPKDVQDLFYIVDPTRKKEFWFTWEDFVETFTGFFSQAVDKSTPYKEMKKDTYEREILFSLLLTKDRMNDMGMDVSFVEGIFERIGSVLERAFPKEGKDGEIGNVVPFPTKRK